MINIQFERLGKDKIVINLEDFENLMDIIAYDQAKARCQEIFPADMADRLIAGENPVRVFRTYRGLSQESLAKASGISRAMIAQIETGRKSGSVDTLKKLSTALDVDLDDLI